MHQLFEDCRFAVRTLRKSAGLTAVIVVSLAIGIGANTAIFSLLNALLLRPLPFPDPDRLAVLWLRSPGIDIPQDWPSPGQYIDIKTQNRSFDRMSISQGRSATLIGLDQPQNVGVLRTSSTLFQMLGAKPLLGRLLLPGEDAPGKPAVAILSYAIWRRLFNSDPEIVGRNITLSGAGEGGGAAKNQFEVAGVLRPDFLLDPEIMPTVGSIERMDIYLPLPLGADAVNRRGDENYNLMARLKPGVTIGQAQADIAVIAARIRDKDKRDRTFTISVVPLLEQVVGNVRLAVLVLLGSVALVLLIACANVANLLLSRAAARQKEFAIRGALGAGWERMARQLLTESLLLAFAGGAAGLLIAKAAIYVVRSVNPGNIPRLDAIAIDFRVLAFTFLVSAATGIAFGLAPALRAARVDLNTSLKSGSRGAQGDGGFVPSRQRLRSALVVSELAFSLMLLVGAGLLLRSFATLSAVSPGFNPGHVISMRLGATGLRYATPAAVDAAWRDLFARIAALPGVRSTGGVATLPFTSAIGWGGINVEGFTPQPGQELQVDMRSATPDYFRTMEIPLRQGRFLTQQDAAASPSQSVLIDEKFAQRFWPRENPVGKQVWFDPQRKMTIVGVVGTVKQYGLDVDGKIVVYFPSARGRYVVARTAGDPAAAAQAIARQVQAVDPTIPLYDVRTMDDRMHDSLARQRFSTIMLGAFAVFALILASVGIYGVISYLVTQGTHDLGVRIALGAQRGNIVALVLRHALGLAAAGIALGLAGAFLLTRVMAALLFGVGARDPLTFAAVPLLLAAVAAAASYLPALRATRVDPIVALREE